LSDSDDITFFNTESRRNVCGKVGVSLLVSGVLGNEVEVFSADNQGSVHLGGNDGAGEDTASNRNHAGEGALLVCDARKYRVSVFVRPRDRIQNVHRPFPTRCPVEQQA
jgi:hypothetical protein